MTRSSKVRNVLFIMCDQLRWDYLSCTGHPRLKTPNIDALAARGVLFERAYCSAPTCGPSRMSFYTGRSMFSHGAVWNFSPLSIREKTIGDHLRPSGMDVALVGKTHFAADTESMARLGVPPDGPVGTLLREGGFRPVDHYEGHANPGKEHPYTRYLHSKGYDAADPWDDIVMSAIDENGQRVSGWNMRNVHLPALVREEHSETAYTTDKAIEYMRSQADRPWFLHLSYIKPHWPYLAPAPYHSMYGPEDCLPLVKSQAEIDDPHPVFAAYRTHLENANFGKDPIARHVVPAYMGLVKQLDDHIGRLMRELESLGRLEDTLIVFTSDHGDYLGDHWLGDKDLFHDASSRIPFIVCDPDPGADATRGSRSGALVEAADFLPTVLEALSLPAADHLIEGKSLLGQVRTKDAPVHRDFAVCELDYGFRPARKVLGRDKRRCRGYMLRSDRWKFIYWEGYPPQLFDMQADPSELVDLGSDTGHAAIRAEMTGALFEWVRSRKLAVTLPDEAIVISEEEILPRYGIAIGAW